jgi:hypothetical protein
MANSNKHQRNRNGGKWHRKMKAMKIMAEAMKESIWRNNGMASAK